MENLMLEELERLLDAAQRGRSLSTAPFSANSGATPPLRAASVEPAPTS